MGVAGSGLASPQFRSDVIARRTRLAAAVSVSRELACHQVCNVTSRRRQSYQLRVGHFGVNRSRRSWLVEVDRKRAVQIEPRVSISFISYAD